MKQVTYLRLLYNGKQVKNLGLIRVVQTLSLSQVITISTPSVPKSHQNLGSKAGESYAETAKGDRSLSLEMTWALLSSALKHRHTYFTIGTKTKLYRTVTVKPTLGSHSIFVTFAISLHTFVLLIICSEWLNMVLSHYLMLYRQRRGWTWGYYSKHPMNSQQTNESGLSHACQHPNTTYRLMREGSLDRWLPKNKLNKLINKWSQQREGFHLSKKLHKHQVFNEGRAFTQPQWQVKFIRSTEA